MSTYKRKIVRYVHEGVGDTEMRLVVEGDWIREARLVNPHGTIPFLSFLQMQEAIACLTEAIRRFNDEATKEYGENPNLYQTKALSADWVSGLGEDTLPEE